MAGSVAQPRKRTARMIGEAVEGFRVGRGFSAESRNPLGNYNP
jgi:hypothetical protein